MINAYGTTLTKLPKLNMHVNCYHYKTVTIRKAWKGLLLYFRLLAQDAASNGLLCSVVRELCARQVNEKSAY